MKFTKRYGLPFKGYMSSVPRHMVPDGYAADGYNYDYVAKDGSFRIRGGSSTKVSAMLENALGTIQPRRIIPFTSESLSDGQETFGVLYGGDDYGCFAFHSTGTAANATPDARVVGDDYSATQYPANFKMIPLLANGAYTRCVTAAERAVLADGSYNAVEVADQILCPSYNGIPHVWNKRFNASTTTGSENVRIMPAGAIPPLIPPQIDSWAGTSGPFNADQWFYVSLVYEYEDGSISQPFIPRPPIANIFDGVLSGFQRLYGYGLVQVNGVNGLAATSSQERESVTMRIYRGGHGCKKVHVLASPQMPTPEECKITDLQVWFSVDADTIASTNGKPVTIRDFNLTPDPRLVRFDRIWMPPTRFAWVGDQRVWAGGSSGFRGGIIIAPAYNGTDETPLNTGATGEEIEITATTLVCRYGEGGGAATSYTYTFSSNTIQDLCDSINGLAFGNTSRFVAQLVPGTDPTMPANQLLDNIGDNTGDGSGRIACFSTAYPAVAWVKDSYRDQFTRAIRRRVYYTEGGPGLGGLSPHTWIAGNYRDVADSFGDFVAGGSTPAGQVCAYTRGVAVLRNTRDNRTGLDQDYYFTMINERRGCISPDSFIQGDGWVAYLTEDGLVACDGEREVIISKAVYNPKTKEGDWADEVDKCKNAMRDGTGTALFRAAVVDGKIYVSFRGGSKPDTVMVYDFTEGTAASGLAELLRPDGTEHGWSTPFRYEFDSTGVGIGAMGAVVRSDGTHIYAASDTTATNGRVEEIEQTSLYNYDAGAAHSYTCTTNTTPGTDTYITAVSGDFRRVAWGAEISGTPIFAGTTVSSVGGVGDDPTQLTMSVGAAGAGDYTLTFTGRTILARLYCKTDMNDIARRKALKKIAPAYVRQYTYNYLEGFQLSVSRDAARATEDFILLVLSSTNDSVTTYPITPPVRFQAPGKAHEIGFYNDGGDVDFVRMPVWGVEAEYELMDSNR